MVSAGGLISSLVLGVPLVEQSMNKWVGERLYMILDPGEVKFKLRFLWIKITEYDEETGWYYGKYA